MSLLTAPVPLGPCAPCRPNDPFIISEVKLAGGFVSGYKMWNVPLQYADEPDSVICKGDYELWWTQRKPNTLDTVVELKKKFRVTEPPCIWDPETRTFALFADYSQSIDDFDVATDNWLQYLTFVGVNSDANLWQEFMTAQGSYYQSEDGTIAYAGRIFRNRRTGVTTFKRPDQRFTSDAEWLNVTSPSGEPVYLNRRTGVTQYEDPASR